jgi:CHAD domain-containing protein
VAVDNARSLSLLRKLEQLLAKTPAKPLPERVHLVRTVARRVEALLETLADRPNRKQRKLSKRLKRLRRGAGKVRDIDVQIAALRRLKIGREQERKARLMQSLVEKRGKREQKLAKALRHKNTQKVRQALRHWSAEISSATQATAPGREFDGVTASLRMFSTLSRQVRALTPENLHGYRTSCKQIRYVAEMAGNTREAKQIVEQLKRMQDVIGDWHDWRTLTDSAESLFSRSLDSALMAALHNVTNAKFVEARSVCQESRRRLLAQYRAMLAEKRTPPAPSPKPSTPRKRRKRVTYKAAADATTPSAIPSKAAAAVGVSQTDVA